MVRVRRVLRWWLGLNALGVVALILGGGRPDTNLVPHDALPILMRGEHG